MPRTTFSRYLLLAFMLLARNGVQRAFLADGRFRARRRERGYIFFPTGWF